MGQDRGADRVTRRLAGFLLAVFTVFWVAQWPGFPILVDPAYHLSVARQVVEAGGPMAYEWWQDAPVGRPHLYPPLLHLFLAGILKLGAPPITALRLLTALLIPAVMVSVYVVARRLFGSSMALASLWAALLPYVWMLQLGGALASGIGVIELLWLLVALVEGRRLAAAMLFALLCYTHLGLPWVALLSLGTWCVIGGEPARRRAILGTLGLGVLISLPILARVLTHVGMLQVTSRYENKTIEWMPLLLAMAGWGAWRAWRGGSRPRWLLSFWVGSCVMAYQFTARWLNGEGLLPVVLLAGYGLDDLARRMVPRAGNPAIQRGAACVLAGLLLMAPTLISGPSGGHWVWPDTAPFQLAQWPGVRPKAADLHLYTPHMQRLVKELEQASRPGEIVWSNATYAGGLVAALAHRATSSAMLPEVPPARPFDAIGSAHLIVWFKIAPLPDQTSLDALVRRYRVQLVAEDPLALVFRSPSAHQFAHAPEAVIPWGVAFMLLCTALVAIGWDLHRQRPAEQTRA